MKELIHKLDPKKIYAFQHEDGGIYKSAKLGDDKFHFLRIDNKSNYYSHPYNSIQELIDSHYENNHKECSVFEFDDQKEFFEWCAKLEKHYK